MRGRETTHLGVDFLQNKTFHFDFESPFSNSEIQEYGFQNIGEKLNWPKFVSLKAEKANLPKIYH